MFCSINYDYLTAWFKTMHLINARSLSAFWYWASRNEIATKIV